jgi:hypothetical protein
MISNFSPKENIGVVPSDSFLWSILVSTKVDAFIPLLPTAHDPLTRH